MNSYQSKILGTGRYLPDRIMSNDEISKMVDTNNQWIIERTGIHERRISNPKNDELPSGMAARAAKIAIAEANLTPNDIDFILFSVTIPDMLFPNTASVLQGKLGITNGCACLDISAACTGWMYGFVMADSLIKSGTFKNILLVGSEMTSSFNNWSDRRSCILFGDGAGAMVIGRSPINDQSRMLTNILGADSTKREHLMLAAGGAAKPITPEILEKNEQFVTMNGQEVFKAAVKTMAAHCEKILQEAGLTLNDIQWFVPHQANMRILEAVAARMGVPDEKIVANVDKYANTSSASIPIAFDEAVRDGRIKRGDKIMVAAFGAGLTSGAGLFVY